MASIKTRVDDVLYHQKNRIEEADGTAKIKVPGMVVGKARGNENLTFDIKKGGQGEKELRRMEEAALKATREAWAPILALKGRTPSDPNAEDQEQDQDVQEELDVENLAQAATTQSEVEGESGMDEDEVTTTSPDTTA